MKFELSYFLYYYCNFIFRNDFIFRLVVLYLYSMICYHPMVFNGEGSFFSLYVWHHQLEKSHDILVQSPLMF
jgi:hypothetical protein